jgi:hypothetical protein
MVHADHSPQHSPDDWAVVVSSPAAAVVVIKSPEDPAVVLSSAAPLVDAPSVVVLSTALPLPSVVVASPSAAVVASKER